MSFELTIAVVFAFGIGFGYFVQRAGLCFSHGLGEIFIGKGKRIARLFIVIFVITSIGFLAYGIYHHGFDNSLLGLKTIGHIRGQGFLNLLSGICFGAGIFLNGGCILGTLRQIGEGNMLFLIVLASFIPGMALIKKVFDPYMTGNEFFIQKGYRIPELLGVAAPYVTGVLVLACVGWFAAIRKGKRKKV